MAGFYGPEVEEGLGIVSVDDLSNWFARIFLADAVLPLLVPGFMAAERANENVTPPYGVFSVELAGDVTYNSGIQEWKAFTLTAIVYGDQNTTADSSMIQQRMNFVYPEQPPDSALRSSGEFVFTMIPQAASAKFAPELRNANDVVMNRFSWKVRTVGDTSQE